MQYFFDIKVCRCADSLLAKRLNMCYIKHCSNDRVECKSFESRKLWRMMISRTTETKQMTFSSYSTVKFYSIQCTEVLRSAKHTDCSLQLTISFVLEKLSFASGRCGSFRRKQYAGSFVLATDNGGPGRLHGHQANCKWDKLKLNWPQTLSVDADLTNCE